MTSRHKVMQELERRGIRTKFFCNLHNISVQNFYSTISGVRPNRKCIKAIHKEGMLDMLLDEFPHYKEKVEDMFL